MLVINHICICMAIFHVYFNLSNFLYPREQVVVNTQNTLQSLVLLFMVFVLTKQNRAPGLAREN